MNYKTFPYATQNTTSWSRQVERVDIQFGNGYSESYMRDPHGSVMLIGFSFSHNLDTIKDVLAFLKSHEDGSPFYIHDPITNQKILVRMSTNVDYSFDNSTGSVKCQFREIKV